MKKLLSLVYGWIGGAIAGGVLLTASSWAHDTFAREFSTFSIPGVLFQTFAMIVWVGMIMLPGVIIAGVVRFLWPDFRDGRSLILACLVALVSITALFGVMGTANANDIPILTIFGAVAMFVAGFFWWVTLKTDRAEQADDTKPENVPS